MYFLSSGAHGHCPASSWQERRGFPTECKQGINSPLSPRTSRTLNPTLAIICMLATTYGESVISTPIFAIGEPIGPMEKGITYIIRPLIQPLYKPFMAVFNSDGSTQLFVGPASSFFFEAIYVLFSTLATSEASERKR